MRAQDVRVQASVFIDFGWFFVRAPLTNMLFMRGAPCPPCCGLREAGRGRWAAGSGRACATDGAASAQPTRGAAYTRLAARAPTLRGETADGRHQSREPLAAALRAQRSW